MMRFLLAIFLFSLTAPSSAQLLRRLNQSRDCGLFIVDLNNGTVNSLNPVASIESIKQKLPCFTSATAETGSSKCGGGVFFKNKHVSFFTGLDYIAISAKFNGTISYNKHSVQLIGATLSQATTIFGHQPDGYKATTKPNSKIVLYSMSYGVIALELLFDHVVGIDICNQKKESIRLCE